MNKLSTADRVRVLSALVEGNSIRATVRMTGVARNTVSKLLEDMGAACERFTNEHVHGLAAKNIQVDEIWSFCYAKAKNVPEHLRGQFGYGDVWTWTAIDADTKFAVSWHVGQRDGDNAVFFMRDVASRVTGRPQITSDGLNAYRWAISSAFDGDVDHAVVQKIYGSSEVATGRYSPPQCIGMTKEAGCGSPDMTKASTSFVERQNLTMRMGMRRFTRLTNGFSKKVENLAHAVALHFVHYNFCRMHQTLKSTPAQAAGLADHRWSMEELVGLLDSN
ncbi:MAG: IS1 family transposase [Planctomycetes bacterium]|nr:IS1 family transposase [Planctomycetota bacterium]